MFSIIFYVDNVFIFFIVAVMLGVEENKFIKLLK